MSRQATHRGTCQACGRIQKLPCDDLSIHGYTKQWGFFQGRCRGSGHAPFELRKDLIDTCIQGAMNAITRLQVQRGDLFQTPTPETKAWLKIYVGYKHNSKNSYAWKRGAVTSVAREYYRKEVRATDYFWTEELSDVEIAQNRKPLTETIRGYDLPGVKSITEAITELNKRYAIHVIDPESKQLRTYVEWQQQRIKDWSPKPLLPLENDTTATEELQRAGARIMPYMHGSKTINGWWIGDSLLGRDAKHALATLKKIKK